MTPEDAYFIPILRVLVNRFNGRAKPSWLYHLVEAEMKDILNDWDYRPLPNLTKPEIRWQHNMRAARKIMRDRLGWISRYSPHGVWQVTDEGRQHLAQFA